ncbi:hypothetical protein ABL78_8410 [Leptomonas seymouri]|uniref:Uncharacterized protein n=1 Tax=Leptomonas seymouri TaxID=5684 RepID=A0A0N1HR31_LEPSE|nr:hypothetical protein ABL78_8410 [Leptomonas seymouri]|eukprot:KPI82581.1 hypothetical protein ABL78_8410 [Leptomonas seymouri]
MGARRGRDWGGCWTQPGCRATSWCTSSTATPRRTCRPLAFRVELVGIGRFLPGAQAPRLHPPPPPVPALKCGVCPGSFCALASFGDSFTPCSRYRPASAARSGGCLPFVRPFTLACTTVRGPGFGPPPRTRGLTAPIEGAADGARPLPPRTLPQRKRTREWVSSATCLLFGEQQGFTPPARQFTPAAQRAGLRRSPR